MFTRIASGLATLALAQGVSAQTLPVWDESITTPNAGYNVYGMTDSGGTNYISSAKLGAAAQALDRSGVAGLGNPLGYHDGYVKRGFLPPYFSTASRPVYFYDCQPDSGGFDCDNGLARPSAIFMPTKVYAPVSNSCIRATLGHELFHHVEYAYGELGDAGCSAVWGKTACEGQARAMQDKIYFDLDLNPAASCVATYRGQVNSYLGNPNRRLWEASYSAALFWTYLMEQYGTYPFEPERGVDFLTHWWEVAAPNVDAPNVPQITDNAIKDFAPTDSVVNAFHDFTLANALKDLDLSGTSEAFRRRYTYRDEDPVPLFNNLMAYDDVAYAPGLTVHGDGTITSTPLDAQKYGARYMRVLTRSCPAGSTIRMRFFIPLVLDASTLQFVARSAIFSLVGVRGTNPGRPVLLYKNRSSGGWTQDIVQPQNPLDALIAISSGRSADLTGTLTSQCLPPPPSPQLPLAANTRPLDPGAPGARAIGEVDVVLRVPGGAPLPGFDAQQFGVRVGTQAAEILGARRERDGYRVAFRYPAVSAAGTYDLGVRVGNDETIAPGAVRYGSRAGDRVLVVDLTSSMGGAAGRLAGLRRAAHTFVDSLDDGDALGLVTFGGGGTEPNDDAVVRVAVAALDPTQRAALHTQIDALAASGSSTGSIGDGLARALAAINAGGTPGRRRDVVLVTDGADGEAQFVANVLPQLQSAGVAVHAVAVGLDADQGLLANLARATGGTYRAIAIGEADDPAAARPHVKVFDGATGTLVMQQHSASATDTLAAGAPRTVSLLLPAVQKVRESAARMRVVVDALDGPTGALADIAVIDPTGARVIDGIAGARIRRGAGYAVVDVPNAPYGLWQFQLTGASAANGVPVYLDASVDASAEGRLTLGASRVGTDDGSPLAIGEPLLVTAGMLGVDPLVPLRAMRADVELPDGSTQALALFDDGRGGDALAGDGVWSATFRATRQGSATGIADNPALPGANGSYTIRGVATLGERDGKPFEIDTIAALHVREAGAPADSDGDGLPDRYEAANACLSTSMPDATLDADRDGATSIVEYRAGSDPCATDSDGGGELDGSEIAHGDDPLDASDDALPPLEGAYVDTIASDHEDDETFEPGTHTIRFDADPRYSRVDVMRATDPAGPFTLVASIPRASGGRFVMRGLAPGATYWYQLQPRAPGGRNGVASAVFSAIAKSDPVAPGGSVVIAGGLPKATPAATLPVALRLYRDAPATSQMRLRVNGGEWSAWMPFADETAVPTGMPDVPATLTVSAMFRDAAGNESVEYNDDIDLVPAASVGTIVGRVLLGGAAPAPAQGLVVELAGDDTLPTAATGATGAFRFDALDPATYQIDIARPGYVAQRVTASAVAPGATVDVGTITLRPEDGDTIFADGFESP